MKKNFFLLIVSAFTYLAKAQSVSVNNDGSQPNGRSILDIKSSDKGVLLPRMTSAQRNAIQVVPGDAGLIVFDTDKQCLFVYTGSKWMVLPFQGEKSIHPVDYTAPDGQDLDQFGSAVAIYGDYAAVGAPSANIGSNADQGAVYVFRYNGVSWEFQTKVTAADGMNNDYFGSSVAISDNYLVVGSPNADADGQNERGAVYVFSRQGNAWNQQTKLMMADGLASDQFGRAVALQGTHLLIGAPYDDNGSYVNHGSAYLFKYNGSAWLQSNKFIPTVMENSVEFGSSVTIDGDYLAIGAPGCRENNAFRAGAVFVYNGPGGANWTLQQKLTNSQPAFEHFFGRSIDLHGSRLVVGVPGQPVNSQTAAGMISIFVRINNSWSLENYVFSTDPQTEAYLGNAVAIRNTQVMGGAYLYDEEGQLNSGAVWVYSKPVANSSWIFDRKITGSDVERVGFFGNAMAMDKQTGRYIIGSSYVSGGRGKVSFGSYQ